MQKDKINKINLLNILEKMFFEACRMLLCKVQRSI